MAKITILTRMYNPGKYVYRCVDSVLNQTFADFEYVIVDNASSDGTKEILEEYARKDKRIRLLRNEENNVTVLQCFENYVDSEYFMVLDHDDWLESNALEELFKLVEKYDLDIAYGRTNFKTADEEFIVARGVNKNVVLDSKDIPSFLRHTYWQFRTTWAAVIRSSLISHIDVETYKYRACSKYGGDTVMMISMAFASQRIGFTESVVHNYRVHASSSYTFCRERFVADWVLFDFVKKLLEEKSGYTKENEILLYEIYGNAICDTVEVVINSGQDFDTIVSVIEEIVEHPHTKELFMNLENSGASSLRVRKLFGQIIYALYSNNADDTRVIELLDNWLKILFANLKFDEKDYELLKESNFIELICSRAEEDIYVELFRNYENYDKRFGNIMLKFLLKHERNTKVLAERLLILMERIDCLYEKIPVYVGYLASKNNLLQGLKVEDYNTVLEVVLRVISEDYVTALNCCLDIINTVELANIKTPLEIALRLSAVLENAGIFVALKKLECSILLDENNYAQAKYILADLEDMCPDDPDVSELKIRLK